MSLLSEVAQTETAKAEGTTKGAVTEGTTKAKKMSDYQKRQRELLKTRIAVIAAYVDAAKNVPDDVKDAVDGLMKRGKYESKGGFGTPQGPDTFKVLFGDTPKVGTVVTAQDMFNKVHKGLADMRKLIKKWAEKGIIVEFDEQAFSYKLTKLA